ncbi:uncharacterized protein LOC144903155 [Branchiostoma floridae x Branchiostoma belcheri]
MIIRLTVWYWYFPDVQGGHLEMVTVISCNFARVAIYRSQYFTKEDGTEISQDKNSRFSAFKAQFEGHKDFGIEYKSFQMAADKIDNAFTQWAKFKRSQNQDDKETYLAQFSPEMWKKLSGAEKETHQLQSERNGKKVQCRGCFAKYRALADTFNTVVSKDLTTRTFFKANPVVDEELHHNEQDIKTAARQWYEHGNRTFVTLYKTSLANALVHVPEVQEAFDQQNRIKQHGKVASSVKANIEQQWQEQNNDVIVHQGTRESDSKYDERRLAMGYETTESAKKRTRDRLAKEAEGRCRKKRRVGKSTEWGTWDWESIRQEVTSWPDGKEVSWRAYALEKGVHNKKGEPAKNGGQMIQDWLIQEGINIHRFKTVNGTSNAKTPRSRRQKKRIPNTKVTMPTPRSAKQMRRSLGEMVKDGEIPIGEMIVPKEFEKMVIDRESGKVEVKTFTVEGRKYLLQDIRKRTLQEHKQYMRLRKDKEYEEMPLEDVVDRLKQLGEFREEDDTTELRQKLKDIEQTRHITVWEDSSGVSNHGHMVYMANDTYDPAIHLTDDEYFEKYGERINVQSHVERPCIYMIARCSSSDSDQLCYCEERRNCMYSMNSSVTVTANGQSYETKDVMRFFKGDLLAREFEAGQQRGGHFPCPCGAHAARFSDIEYVYRTPHQSLADHMQLLKDGDVTWEKTMDGLTAVDHQSKAELVRELVSRSMLDTEEAKAKTSKELQALLKTQLHGVKRPPALLFGSADTPLQNLNLDKYEVLPCEPLHDVSHHIQNLFEELPLHVPPDIQQEIKGVYNATLGNKEMKRGCDYRVALVTLAAALEDRASTHVTELISSLVEIQRLCYLPAERRCQREILRLHNQAFLHAVRLRQVIPKPKKLTSRALYGSYFHALTCHSPLVNRIVALSSTHTESEERVFNQLRGIHRTTGSSRHPGQVIGNMLVRAHCESIIRGDKDAMVYQPSIVSKAAKAKERDGSDTLISIEDIKKYPKAWQAHCERLSDFLLCGKGEWWTVTEDGVRFSDGPSHPDSLPAGPVMIHFRSSSLKSVESHLKKTWQQCLNEDVVIPLEKVYRYDENGDLQSITQTEFLGTSPVDVCEDSMEEVEATTDLTVLEEDSEPVEQLQEKDPGLPALEEDRCIDSEQSQSGSQPSSSPALLGKENIPCENTDSVSSNTPQRKGRKGQTEPLRLFQSTQPSACTREEARLTGDHQMPDSQQCQSNEGKQSSWSKNLRQLLGNIHEVDTFDSLRKKIKDKRMSKDVGTNYDRVIAILQVKISKCYSSLKMEMKEWERDFMSRNNCSCPTLEDLDHAPAQIKDTLKKMQIARALMKAFRMESF